jgi:hypothetical protein
MTCPSTTARQPPSRLPEQSAAEGGPARWDRISEPGELPERISPSRMHIHWHGTCPIRDDVDNNEALLSPVSPLDCDCASDLADDRWERPSPGVARHHVRTYVVWYVRAVRQVGTGIADALSIRAAEHAGDNGYQRQLCGFSDIGVIGRLLFREQQIVLARRYEAPLVEAPKRVASTSPIPDAMRS